MDPSKHPLSKLRDAVSGRPAEQALSEVAREIDRARSLVVVSHINLDGDALGSMAALALALGSRGVQVRAWSAEAPPELYGDLFPAGIPEVVASPQSHPEAADAYVLLDTCDPARAGAAREAFERARDSGGAPRLCLDHHVPGQSARFESQLVVPEAPSTCNLVLALLDRLGIRLNRETARCLWIGIATDTGWFRFSNTDAWALSDAARLSEFGIDTESIYQRVYSDLTPARARVLGAVLSGLRCELGGKLAWAAIPRAKYLEEGLRVPDLDGIVDYLKWIRGAQVVAFLVELEGGIHKVSLRATGPVEVGSIARDFGGGGHDRAAGYRYRGTAEEVAAALARRLAAAWEAKTR